MGSVASKSAMKLLLFFLVLLFVVCMRIICVFHYMVEDFGLFLK
jgi:hypothetical protein